MGRLPHLPCGRASGEKSCPRWNMRVESRRSSILALRPSAFAVRPDLSHSFGSEPLQGPDRIPVTTVITVEPLSTAWPNRTFYEPF